MEERRFDDLAVLSRKDVVAQALDLLDRAIMLLDHEHLDVVAAKLDEARCALRGPVTTH